MTGTQARRSSYLHARKSSAPDPLVLERRMAEIVARVAAFYDTTPEALRGKEQSQELSLARHVAWLLSYDSSPYLALKDIAAYFGDRDHSTVIYGLGRVRTEMKKDGDIAKDVADLRRELALKERA